MKIIEESFDKKRNSYKKIGHSYLKKTLGENIKKSINNVSNLDSEYGDKNKVEKINEDIKTVPEITNDIKDNETKLDNKKEVIEQKNVSEEDKLDTKGVDPIAMGAALFFIGTFVAIKAVDIKYEIVGILSMGIAIYILAKKLNVGINNVTNKATHVVDLLSNSMSYLFKNSADGIKNMTDNIGEGYKNGIVPKVEINAPINVDAKADIKPNTKVCNIM